MLGCAGFAYADTFTQKILPFTENYCTDCHGDAKAKADLNMEAFDSDASIAKQFRIWGHIADYIRDGEMPPKKSQKQPTQEERDVVLTAIEKVLYSEALRGAGDPGIVPPRRLSKVEFDTSVSDLIGVPVHTTANFPPDPAGGEGFDNTGESLGMSPNLLKKYLAAAETAASHLVLKPGGIDFSPYPAISYNERKKFTEQAIIDFYKRHDPDRKEYLAAAHYFKFGKQDDIQAYAEHHGLSPKYLSLVYNTLESAHGQFGYVGEIGRLWKALPTPEKESELSKALSELESYIQFVHKRLHSPEQQLIRSNAGNWPISHLDFREKQAAKRDTFDNANYITSKALRFDKFRTQKEKDPETRSLFIRLDPAFPESKGNYVLFKAPIVTRRGDRPKNDEDWEKHNSENFWEFLGKHAPELAKEFRFGQHPGGGQLEEGSFVLQAPAMLEIPLTKALQAKLHDRYLILDVELDPEKSKESVVILQYSYGRPLQEPNARNSLQLANRDSQLMKNLEESANLFCKAFPNRFYYTDKSRGLAAGFHLVEGFFRDDRPLVEKVLTDSQKQEIDRLWDEFDFVIARSETLLRGFVWFERSERHVLHDKRFDFLRAEDPELTTPAMLHKFEKVYLDKMNIKRIGDTLDVEKPEDSKYLMIHKFFEDIGEGLVRQKQRMQKAEPQALAQLEDLATKAWRRPLTKVEKTSQQQLYQTLREQGQDVETALRGTFAAILLSPDFCFRYNHSPSSTGIQPLPNHELASRLSYFLWSSIPDPELLEAATKGQLQDEKHLRAQIRRMLQSPKMATFAREFLGQWLRYRDYLEKDPIHAESFKDYDDQLRQALFEEPTRLTTWLINEDRPVTDLLTSDVTFLNRRLARHYTGKFENLWRATRPDNDDSWQRVEGIRELGRGGIPGMGIILTTNSAGARTSPVKRGFWTVHHLLGRHFPPPPADVPELPADEKSSPKTIREMMAAHTENPDCAMCHQHFDSLGLALEGFDPTGKPRTRDLANRPIDNLATLPNGESTQGLDGLLNYLENERRDDFVKTLCRKFLGYALGRSLTLYDEPLLRKMQANLAANNYHFSSLFETVVLSKQFRNQRGSMLAKSVDQN